MNERRSRSLVEGISSLAPRAKEPNSARTLNAWIAAAERELGVGGQSDGRTSWLVATTIAAAKLQQVVDDAGTSRFALKGGTLLQYRLGLSSRATKDLDGIVRGDLDDFFGVLDARLLDPWGTVGFSRSPVEEFRVPNKLINPRRLTLTLSVSGRPWRSVKVEISPDEGAHGTPTEGFVAPRLGYFGLPTPDMLIGIVMSYQIAEKIHAASDPHNPPDVRNDRARDVVDLVLLKHLVDETGDPSEDEIRSATIDIFESRAQEAKALDLAPRTLPVGLTAYSHWDNDYERAARSAGIHETLEESVAYVNDWIDGIMRIP